MTLWHIGFVTPAEQYAGMEQTNGEVHDAVAAAIDSPEQSGSSSVTGTTWQRWTQPDGKRRAITHTVGTVSVVVDGTAAWAELEQLAAALRPQR